MEERLDHIIIMVADLVDLLLLALDVWPDDTMVVEVALRNMSGDSLP